MKKYLFTGLALIIITFAHGQNVVSGPNYIGGVMYDASSTGNTTLQTGGSIMVDASGTWFFNNANVVTPRTSATQAEAISFNTATTTFSRTTGFVNGYAATITPATNFVLPIGQTTYMPLTFTAASPATVQAAWYDTGAPTKATVGSSWFTLNAGFYDLNSSVANSTIQATTPTGLATSTHLIGFNGSTFSDIGLVGSTVTLPTSSSKIFFGTLGVTLSAKVFLQGAAKNPTTVGFMRNDLQQNLAVNAVALLPTTSPYGAPLSVYTNINNPASTAGAVVDWVKVQVRSATTPTLVLETQSLLLKSDGTIVDVTGASPFFSSQSGSVRIAIFHRNHLAILSNAITSFSGAVGYDFTTSLAQAYKGVNDGPQMEQVGSNFCMITGDINQDYNSDNSDISLLFPDSNNLLSNVYRIADVNLDGSVDNSDVSTLFTSTNSLFNSAILNL